MPRLHVVTNDAVLARPDFHDVAAALLEEAGRHLALHLRAKSRPAASLLRSAEKLGQAARQCGAQLIINERLDIALASGADGAHLGEGAMQSVRARAFLGPQLVLGRSLHTIEAVVRAEEGTDYVFLGTILPSQSHPAASPLGLEVLAEAAAKSRLPVIAIGGIGIDRIAEVMATGVRGVAMISAIWDASDPRTALREAIRTLENDSGQRGRHDTGD